MLLLRVEPLLLLVVAAPLLALLMNLPGDGWWVLPLALALGTPTLTLTSRLRTRDRAVDWSEHGRISEDPALLRANLAPTTLLPTDGIVRKTAVEATRGAKTDLDKVRAIYQWVVANAHREPTVRGCGSGDIKAMLETGNLGGKCADLNAVFVGLCRSAGIPIAGGHTIDSVEPIYGLVAMGLVHPSRVMRNADAKVGDRLILGKPLGVGILSAALKKEQLDAAGYADSNGYFNADSDRPLAFRYRDYVIRALNRDKPFDQFITEQLAGDELVLPPYERLDRKSVV